MNIEALSANWLEIKREVAAHFHRRSNLTSQTSDILNGRPVADDPEGMVECSWVHMEHLAEANVLSLFAKAVELFSPVGTTLDIDRQKILESVGYQGHHQSMKLKNYDPAVLWKAIETMYGGDQGTVLAYQAVAKVLQSNFRLKQSQDVKIVSGAVCLDISVFIDSLDKKFGNTRVHYGAKQTVHNTMTALSSFATWAQRHKLAGDLQRHPFYAHDDLESRRRYPFGDKELEVVTYTTRFQCRFNLELANELQVFIGTYAPLELGVA